MKKIVKILPILMVVLMILMTCSPVLASGASAPASKDKDTSSSGEGTTIAGVTIKPGTESADQVSKIGNNILGIIQVVGTVIAVGVLMVIGIKYMMGSAEEKAEYKKTMLPYLIGAIILFAAVNIASYVVGIAGTFK